LARFENDRTISFIPPDGSFDLMTYRLSTQVFFFFAPHFVTSVFLVKYPFLFFVEISLWVFTFSALQAIESLMSYQENMEMTCELLENLEVLITYLPSFSSKLSNVKILSLDVLSYKRRMHWLLIQCSEFFD
jgi:Adaptor complexes medium subunit family